MKEDTSAFQQGSATSKTSTAFAERRRTPRRPVDRAVALRLVDSGSLGPVPARLVDLSAGGVGLRLQRPLAPGKQFTMEVGNAAGGAGGRRSGGDGEGFALRYQVVRCKPLGHGSFHVGAAFVRTPAPAAPKVNAGKRASTVPLPVDAALPPSSSTQCK